jgi:DNA-binding MarR family transcriptional regulator
MWGAEQRLVTGLAKIGMALRAQSNRQAGGLSPLQGQILALLRARGAMRPGAAAAELGVTLPTVSDSAAALVRKRLIRRNSVAGDKRGAVLSLTRKGAAEAERAASWADFLLAAASALSEDEQRVFLRGLTKMILTLQERGQIPVARMCATCRYFEPNRYPDLAAPHHCAFTGAPFGDIDLRLDCADYETAAPAQAATNWNSLIQLEGIR